MRGATLILFAALILLVFCPAQAQDDQEPQSDPLALFEAYQVGFLQVVAVSCYQIYSATGIVATDYANGYIDEDTARFALDQNALLLSTCSANLIEVGKLTPADDETASAELDRLGGLLDALNQLISALDDLLDNPDDAQAAVVEQARSNVEQLLDQYTAPAPQATP